MTGESENPLSFILTELVLKSLVVKTFPGIHDNQSKQEICPVLIYFSIVDFYQRRLAIFDRHCSDILQSMTQTFSGSKNT